MARTGAVTLREASFDDYERIAALETANGLKVRPRDGWVHFWQENPAWRRRPGWPIGWVLEHGAGRIVGSVSNIPLEYELEGSSLTVSAGRGWAVDPRYRGCAIMLMDELFRQRGVDLFLNTTVNHLAAKAFPVFQSPPVPAGDWSRAAYWITDYRGFARSALVRRGWAFGSAISCYPAAAALRVRDALRGPGFQAAGLEVGSERGFDERFDVFWQQLREKNRHVLLGVRSREALDWHFRRALANQRAQILTVTEGGRLAAYAIFLRKDNSQYGLKRVRLIDYQSLADDPCLLLPMLRHELRLCAQAGVHILEDVGCCIEAARAPHRRELGSWSYYYKAGDAALAETLQDPARWRPSLFDGDSSL